MVLRLVKLGFFLISVPTTVFAASYSISKTTPIHNYKSVPVKVTGLPSGGEICKWDRGRKDWRCEKTDTIGTGEIAVLKKGSAWHYTGSGNIRLKYGRDNSTVGTTLSPNKQLILFDDYPGFIEVALPFDANRLRI